MTQKRIYLGDLSYIREGDENWTIIPIPLNIAYLAAYTIKQFGQSVDIKLFKHPEALLKAIEKTPPDILGLSNYIWNKNLSLGVARFAKEINPAIITVMGGPNYNFDDPEWLMSFFRTNPELDFHIEGEGEVKFANLVGCLFQNDFNLQRTKAAKPAGSAYYNGEIVHPKFADSDSWILEGITVDQRTERISDLEDIPSPFLTGILDEFLLNPEFCPIIETNRGCPYSCTFCVWGDMAKSKSSKFSLERIVAELRYIAEKNISITPYLYLGDANFGIFERDIEIAKVIKGLKDTAGFPENVYLYFAKNSSEKVLKIASILKDMTPMSLSRQTQNPIVLKNIRRSNISVDTYNNLADLAKELGVETYVELIFGLPGESKDSFYNGVREIMKHKIGGLHFFPAMLLDGSEMASKKSRERFGIKGALRRIDGCSGKFGPISATEYEEIIVETNCFSRGDYFELRLFHFFQTLFIDTKIFYDVESVLNGVSFFDFILDAVNNYHHAPVAFVQFVDDFLDHANNEFKSNQNFENDSNRKVVAQADTASNAALKLNPYFTVKLLFTEPVLDGFLTFIQEKLELNSPKSCEEIKSVINFIRERIYQFGGSAEQIKIVAINSKVATRMPTLANCKLQESKDDYVEIRMTKNHTYSDIFASLQLKYTLTDAIYELALHHAHETFSSVLTYKVDCT